MLCTGLADAASAYILEVYITVLGATYCILENFVVKLVTFCGFFVVKLVTFCGLCRHAKCSFVVKTMLNYHSHCRCVHVCDHPSMQ